MLYPVPGKGKPMGLIAPSRDSSSSPSLGDDVEEIERPSPKYKEYVELSYYNSDGDDDGDWSDIYISRDVYAPPGVDWMAMKKAQEEKEGIKPHRKGRVETVKFICTDR